MRVDHRQPYMGDHGIQFDPKDASGNTMKRLAKVRLHKPKRIKPNALDLCVRAVLDLIPFRDHRHFFIRNVRRNETSEELSALSQELIRAGEARKQQQ